MSEIAVGPRVSPEQLREFVSGMKLLQPFCEQDEIDREYGTQRLDHPIGGNQTARVVMPLKPVYHNYSLTTMKTTLHVTEEFGPCEVKIDKDYSVLVDESRPHAVPLPPLYTEIYTITNPKGSTVICTDPVKDLSVKASELRLRGDEELAQIEEARADILRARTEDLAKRAGDTRLSRHEAYMDILRTIQRDLGVESGATE